MTIEFTNATPAKRQSNLSLALLVVSCLFFFIPATLVVLGYYSSLPTGTLVSPLPQGVLTSTPPQKTATAPVVATPQEQVATPSTTIESNAAEKTALLPAKQSEIIIQDAEVLETSQIYLINKEGDKSLYSVKSKSLGQFVISSNSLSETDRLIDYQIVNL